MRTWGFCHRNIRSDTACPARPPGTRMEAKLGAVTDGVTNSAPTGRSLAHDEWMSPLRTAASSASVPLIYYGDEFGMPGGGDPDNRRFMQWSGYNPSQVYLRDRVKKLGEIRHKHPALWRGTRTTIQSDDDTWAFVRSASSGASTDTVYVAINRADSPKDVNGLPSGALTELVAGQAASGPKVTIPPRQTRIFVAK